MPDRQPLNRRILLRSRPIGTPRPDDFQLSSAPVPVPAAGQVLLRTLYPPTTTTPACRPARTAWGS